MIYAFLTLSATLQTPIVVDATKRTPISPYIYGANFPDWNRLPAIFTVSRLGGNRMSAYNWENNASNAGHDYRHQNDGYMGSSDVPGLTMATFLKGAQAHGAIPLLTIPTMGRVSADKGPDDDVNKTPNYLEVRFNRSYARKPGGKYQYPPDLKDKAVYQDECVAYLEKIRSPKTPLWYSLDNEPDLWGSTHQRVWPKNPTYAQVIANNIEFATGIKAVSPKGLTFGPANYGWQGFRNFQNAPDAKGRDFLDVYLAAMRKAERAGKRLLDVLDIHWYPEAYGDGIRITLNNGKEGPGTFKARIQAPRSLWDPTYVEDSWIARNLGNKPIVLLPGVQKQIRTQYPGTKLAITEYDFGGGSHVSGLLAQADVLGSFGRYGVFAACHWGIEANRPAVVGGFRVFRNFDGGTRNFGDQGLSVSGVDPSAASVYAALDSKNPRRMTVVLINKTGSDRAMTVSLKGFAARSAKGYLRDARNFQNPTDILAVVGAKGVSVKLPAESVATLELSR